MKKAFSSNYRGNSTSSSLTLGGLITVVLFLTLPLTQMVSNSKPLPEIQENYGIVIQPPANPLDPPKPEPEENKPEDIEMDKPEHLLTLDQINWALIPGDGGMGKGASAQIYDISGTFEDVIYPPDVLEKPPVSLLQVAPVYPPELKVYNIEGEVHLIFIVDEAGNVKRPKVVKSPHRAFSENAIKAIRQWRFDPGEKDEKKVKTRVSLVMSFTLRD